MMSNLDVRLGLVGIPVAAWAAVLGLTPTEAVRAALVRQVQAQKKSAVAEPVGLASRIQVQIEQELDQALAAAQLRTGLSRSALVRYLVALDVAEQWTQFGIPQTPDAQGAHWSLMDGATDKDRERIEIRLTSSELRALDKQAESLGVSRSQLLVRLVRSHLLSIPLLAGQKAINLGQLNSTLLRVGVDLRAIATRLAGTSEPITQATVEQIQACLRQLHHGVSDVATVLQQSKERWVLVPAGAQ